MSKQDELLGKKFDRLLVLSFAKEKKDKKNCIHYYWNCKCDCGKIKVVDGCNLIYGHTHSCGCFRHGANLTGRKFGKLTVIKEAESQIRKDGKGRKKRWLCKCDCGNEHITTQESLINGSTKSCGCLVHKPHQNPDAMSNKYKRLCKILNGIKSRCCNPADQHHKLYYDRGIRVCDEWKHNTMAFIEWALANGYREGLSIDRIDNDGDYEPNNCRWATNIEQAYNRQCTVKYIIYGKEYNLHEIEETFKIKRGTFYARVKRWGYTPEEAIANMDLRHNAKRKRISKPQVKQTHGERYIKDG